jgi:hypothetical protein
MDVAALRARVELARSHVFDHTLTSGRLLSGG